MRKRRSPRPFHLTWIILICIAPVFATWFLIPRDLEMAERLAQDGHPDRSLAIVKELISLEISQPVDGETGTWEFPAMEALFIGDGQIRIRGGKKTRMLRILLQLSEEPERTFELFRTDPKALDQSVAQDFFAIMASTALRQNKPSLASEIYLCLEHNFGLSEEVMMKAIQAHRFSGSPQLALDLLYEQAKFEGIQISEFPRETRMLLISLHREVNEGAKAFALLKVEFEHAKTEEQRAELIDLLATTAAQSNLFTESLPLLKEYISKTEAATLTWDEMVARKAKHPSDEAFLKYGSTLAQQLLWSGEIEQSFEMYRKLALLDNEDPLDKCVMMAPWIGRSKDLGILLDTVEKLPPGKGFEKLLVDSLCMDGEFSHAEKLLRGWIADGHAEQKEMHRTLADLVFEQRRYKESLAIYREVLEEQGQDCNTADLVISLANLARNLVITGDFELALEAYRKIPIDQHNIKTMGDYQYLAESLNSSSDIMRALEIELTMGKNLESPHAYLSIADAYEIRGELEQAQEWLTRGREACPASRKIVLKAAEILKKRGLHHEALEYLFKNYHRDDIRFDSELIELAALTQRQNEALNFLDLKDPLAASWPASLRMSLADLYESKMDYKTALAIFESVNPEGFEAPKIRLRAQIAFDEGQIREAWKLQEAYIELTPHPSADDLVFLGDLCWYHGFDKDATNAYNAALALLNHSLHPDSKLESIVPGSNL